MEVSAWLAVAMFFGTAKCLPVYSTPPHPTRKRVSANVKLGSCLENRSHTHNWYERYFTVRFGSVRFTVYALHCYVISHLSTLKGNSVFIYQGTDWNVVKIVMGKPCFDGNRKLLGRNWRLSKEICALAACLIKLQLYKPILCEKERKFVCSARKGIGVM